jgi:serine/threonine protein kinase
MTEFVRGGSLAHYLRLHPEFMPLQQRCHLARQAAVGMAYLHERKIVHFDLKPDNLLVDGERCRPAGRQPPRLSGPL